MNSAPAIAAFPLAAKAAWMAALNGTAEAVPFQDQAMK
jgi:hypothetical protein